MPFVSTRRCKKKFQFNTLNDADDSGGSEIFSGGGFGLIDPLAGLDFDIQSFDISRVVSVYPDRSGFRWWTKAWFNNHEIGESAVEIERPRAVDFIMGDIDKDSWLEEYFPKPMEMYHNAIEQTRQQLLSSLTL